MKPNNLDQRLYDAGIHTEINDKAAPLVALQDADALNTITGYLQVHIANISANFVVNAEALQAFILHAQRAGVIDYNWLDESFASTVRNQVPQSPPVAPASLSLTDEGGGVVNATSGLGQHCDRYELYQKIGNVWERVASGTIGETTVDYQVTGLEAGTYQFRVVAKYGFFAGFAGESQQITIT